MTRVIIAGLIFLFSFAAVGQQVRRDNMLDVRREVFESLQKELQRYILTEEEKSVISKEYGIPLHIQLESGRSAHFQYLDESNHPVYYTTHNITAAQTTGANSMQEGGSLNLALAGSGMVVGIYDQTRPRANHNEFGNRVTQVDGSTETISNHATHVTGTILARGNNANAKGMVNEAIGWAFNWDADISKMAQNAYDPDLLPGGHLVSNHSYGILVGWYRDSNNDWAWAGNESVSDREDYRFGFYTAKSRQIDELAFSKPYYTVVWAAGNDRNDIGDGSRDSDGPEDSIGPEGVAKNNITVGAVNGVPSYSGPSSVEMSAFSSWGPVDDGRIKPDLVAMGVNVFSTATANNGASDSYTTLSGTSMAAPNVSGSLFLLQELFHSRNAGRYMQSATLKALAIQTAREAGTSPGPDYIYGWGLLNVDEAARIVIDEDGTSTVIRELELLNNQSYEFDFISDGLEEIKATIAWTDPAGTPPAPSLNPTNLMLVNDLDLRIIDEDGQVYFPWSLNPDEGAGATGLNDRDNFRDNVEQVTISSPQPKRYTLRITHKGSLRNNRQAFSLVFQAGILDGQDETLYWIGEEGSWNDPANWSFDNNGASADRIPDSGTRVIFDRPVSSGTSIVTLSEDASAFSVNFFGNNSVELDLNNNEIRIENGYRVSNQITSIRNGRLLFETANENENLIDFGMTAFDNVDIHFQNGDWRIISAQRLGEVNIEAARLNLDLENIQLSQLRLGENAVIAGRVQEISFSQSITIQENALLESDLGFRFTGANGTFKDDALNAINSLTNDGENLQVQSIGAIGTLRLLDGETLLMQENTTAGILEMQQGIRLDLGNQNKITVDEDIIHEQSSGQPATLWRAQTNGSIIHDLYKKYCFENIQVQNVSLEGQAIINLGANADITNGSNWVSLNCEDVLLANFNALFTCAGAVTEFINTSEGNIGSFRWRFGNQGTSTEENPLFVFNNPGNYVVTLEIEGPGGSMEFQSTVIISPNPLRRPEIVVNGTLLTSQVPSSGYQWYRNGVKIEGAVERSITAENEGNYQVSIIDDACNRISAPVVISSIDPEEEMPIARLGYFIGPNPSDGLLNISIHNEYFGEVEYELFGTNGGLVERFSQMKNHLQAEHQLQLNVKPGVYILWIKAGDILLPHRIIRK